MATGNSIQNRRFRTVFVAVSLTAGAASAAAEAPAQLSLRMSPELTTPVAAAPAGALPAAVPARLAPNAAIIEPTILGPKDYRIGPDDLLEIQVFGVDQLTRQVRVNSRGYVSLPLVGNVAVGGLTSQEAESLIVAKLAENYLQDPQVSLFIKEYTSQRVTIEGAVNKPGIYPLRGSTTLLQTLALAGGQGRLSDVTEVMVFRNEPSGKRATMMYDVEKIRSGEIDDPAVLSEDLIVVKRSPTRVFLKDSVISDFFEAINPFR